MLRGFVLTFILFNFLFSVYPISSDLKEQARAYREEGYELQATGDFGAALSYYLKAAQIDPSYKEVFNDAGVAYEGVGDLDKAEEMYLKAIGIDPNYLSAYTNLGFLFEKKNDFDKAIFYWKKRYSLGRKGESWREEARKHLIKLGAYSQIRQVEIESAALSLSREISQKREQQRLQDLEEARMRFKTGLSFFNRGRYKQASQEFEASSALNSSDDRLKNDIDKYYRLAQKLEIEESVRVSLKNGLNYLGEKDYLSLMQELRKALTLVPKLPRE